MTFDGEVKKLLLLQGEWISKFCLALAILVPFKMLGWRQMGMVAHLNVSRVSLFQNKHGEREAEGLQK